MKKTQTIVLYTAAICNLKCTYCYIDKNPALKEIDDLLKESFKDTEYYLNFIDKICEKRNSIFDRFEFWGGEPSIGLPRIYTIVEESIKKYPTLSAFMMSTNLTPKDWFDNFWGFMSILEKFPKRQFHFDLQLSLDGPKYINDKNRGEGVTDIFITNFKKLVLQLDDKLPDNVFLNLNFKQTYSDDTIKKLQTKEKVLEYFQFYDNLIDFVYQNVNFANVDCPPGVPNTAEPSPHSKADGIRFANYCKICKEIEKEQPFKYYSIITSFTPRDPMKPCYQHHCGNCGTGTLVVGILPNNKYSVCHNGFTDLCASYKQNSKQEIENGTIQERSILKSFFDLEDLNESTTLTEESYNKYADQMDYYYKDNSIFKMLNLTNQIRFLALMGQIDKKYQKENEAKKAADFILSSTSYCIRDNINITGCKILQPIGLTQLLLNGAKEIILNE